MRRIFIIFLLAVAVAPSHAMDISDLPDGLVALWTAGGEGDAILDLSGNGYDGTLMGEEQKPERIESEFLGNVLHFTHVGSPGGALVGINLDKSQNPPGGGMTLAAWVKLDPEGERSTNYIMFSGSNGYVFKLFHGRLRFRYRLEDGSNQAYQIEPGVYSVRSRNWYFVAVTHDGEKVRMYINGNKMLSEEAVGYPAQTGYLAMGNFSLRTSTVTFQGAIGPVLLFNRSLAGGEIFETMKAFF